jgi:hypothetical protein
MTFPMFRIFQKTLTSAGRVLLLVTLAGASQLAAAAGSAGGELPRALDSYPIPADSSLWATLLGRACSEPLNVAALAIFGCAIIHTFLTSKIRHWAHLVEERHNQRIGNSATKGNGNIGIRGEVSFPGQVLHFLGEVEAVFGIWAVVLAAAITFAKGWSVAVSYIGETVNYTEPVFVVVVMALASTRPIMGFAEAGLKRIADLGGGGPAAWWLTILIIAPLLGSLITEPAAMTIGALLLSRRFFTLNPSSRLRYATLGLLFVNVSVGGTLTHFAAPPVIMVARPWGWDIGHMLGHFGWRAAVGIAVSTILYYTVFRKELKQIASPDTKTGEAANRPPAPRWITAIHLGFLAFTVLQAHHPALCIGGLLFYLAFAQATAHHQNALDLRPPILVGFFLAGLVIHGGLQAWWIQPILGRLAELPLFTGALFLTAFNDNAAITYLATLVPGLTDSLRHAVVAGAVAGGGLTVIANAPNPAGQAILAKYFPDGVAPLKLALAALPPTVVVSVALLLGA